MLLEMNVWSQSTETRDGAGKGGFEMWFCFSGTDFIPIRTVL